MALTALQRNIRRLRKARGLSQEELAGLLKLKDKSAISHWEIGTSSPRAHLIPKLARVLTASVAELYGEAAA